ncbi:MAG: hypothetical protein GKR96_01500 [Gammaproteobacteria bacterium]|nr:hypothetical protein [Gammaproteobacteria bacterium]
MNNQTVNVVLFSGGRGSSVLTKQLLHHSSVNLSLIINGYDDGLSTGEVRRFLGDCLGPSDFRKNASRVAIEKRSCEQGLIELLDLRLPVTVNDELVAAILGLLTAKPVENATVFFDSFSRLHDSLRNESKNLLVERMQAFCDELENQQEGFDFSDCSIGNLVFAGSFLVSQRNFNQGVDDYDRLLGLEAGLILNVTKGENAFLVATNENGEYLESEADIVDAGKRNHIKDIFLLDAPIQKESLEALPVNQLNKLLKQREADIHLNEQAQDAISRADLIIYAPGTQHSSLFPSYLTPGLGHDIAKNTQALKLLVTNIEEDAEIPDFNAVEIINKAVYYLREKNARSYPVSSLLTHYLVNLPDTKTRDDEKNYIPLGNMEQIEDPRLIRIGNYEDQETGNHDPEKVLSPFVNEILAKKAALSVAVLLTENSSVNKTVQTVLEMARSKLQFPYDVTIYYQGVEIDYFQEVDLPFKTSHVENKGNELMLRAVLENSHDYVCLMECSGMYHGYDVISLISNLNQPNVDAVWGSRRLSASDMKASYKFRYRHRVSLGAVSYIGSYMLSLSYLSLYGRYVSDTLSGLRVVKSHFLRKNQSNFERDNFNQYLLSDLLDSKGRVFEVPVDFLPMSPNKVRRTSILQGLNAFWVIMTQRMKSLL